MRILTLILCLTVVGCTKYENCKVVHVEEYDCLGSTMCTQISEVCDNNIVRYENVYGKYKLEDFKG